MAIYTRPNPEGYPTCVSTALQQKAPSRTAARLPVVTGDHNAAATSQLARTYIRQAAAAVTEENANDDTERAPRPPSRCGGGGGSGAQLPTSDGGS